MSKSAPRARIPARLGSARRPANLELFCCAGGMAHGFLRGGIVFDRAIDFAPDHCASYTRNLGHAPLCADARVLLEHARNGKLKGWHVDLLVADPPCTPWSRAGKRLGTSDQRDMLQVTCEIIAALRPRRFLIGNVPGLDDDTNLHIVQRHIGGLAAHGYCVADFARLDAADYGVPQHRIRPWWFGHREGPCIQWPVPTHADPRSLETLTLPGIEPLKPWVTCREALGHLHGDEIGRAVRMRERHDNGKQKGSVADPPARVVGTSNLSDGNVIAMPITRHDVPIHTSEMDAPARAITTQCRAPGHATTIVFNGKHAPADLDAPAPTLGAKYRGQGAQVLLLAEPTSKHPAATPDEPSPTIRAGGGGRPQSSRVMVADRPATTVQARTDRKGAGSPVLEWPWDRPATTVYDDPRLGPVGHHDPSFMSRPDAIILSERAAAILQGFPDDGSWVFCGKTKKARWSQIGQAMPPPFAEAVARSVVKQDLAARAAVGKKRRR